MTWICYCPLESSEPEKPQVKSPEFVKFKLNWDIIWLELDSSSTKRSISKRFVTIYNHVAYNWLVEFSRQNENSKNEFEFRIFYVEGPVPKLANVCFAVIAKSDGQDIVILNSGKYEARRGLARKVNDFGGYSDTMAPTVDNFYLGPVGSSATVSEKFEITIEIPISAFSYTIDYSINLNPPWLSEMHENLTDPEKSENFDIQLISKEGEIFFCHKFVIIGQSPILALHFRNSTITDKLEFLEWSSEVLQHALEFLYTRHASFKNSAISTIVEIAEFANEHQIWELKKICEADLWKKVIERPMDCGKIVRYADAHKLEYLKDRAMSVLLENYKQVEQHIDFLDVIDETLDEQGIRLSHEFNTFVSQVVDVRLE